MASYILEKAHEAVREVVKAGDTAIDATVGNGWDTVFLARIVGSTGRVIGFDMQTIAIDTARRRLSDENLLERCDLFEQSHENPSIALGTIPLDPPTAVMFNLGYLPGGDRSITTTPSSTIRSLEEMLKLLASKGLITIVAYKGHHGARQEFDEVEDWVSSLDSKDVATQRVDDPVGPLHAPTLFVIRKR